MDAQKPFTQEEFKNIYSRVPRLCVDLIFQTPEGVLLTLRDIEPYKNLWHIPGGTVFYRETIDEAARRIAKEELGVDIRIVKLAGYLVCSSEVESRGGWGWPIALEIICDISSGEPRVNEQAREVGFFKDIPENTIEEHKKFLEKILRS